MPQGGTAPLPRHGHVPASWQRRGRRCCSTVQPLISRRAMDAQREGAGSGFRPGDGAGGAPHRLLHGARRSSRTVCCAVNAARVRLY